METNGKSEEKAAPKRNKDPEMAAIRQIEYQLSKLESFAVRERVIEFVARRVAERRGEQLRLQVDQWQDKRPPEPARQNGVGTVPGTLTGF